MYSNLWWTFMVIIISPMSIFCYPEQGKWDFILMDDIQGHGQSIVITKSLYKEGKFAVSILCQPEPFDTEFSLNVTWYIRKVACWKEYYESTEPFKAPSYNVFKMSEYESFQLVNETSYYVMGSEIHPCDDKNYYLSSTSKKMMTESDIVAAKSQAEAKALVQAEEKSLLSLTQVKTEVKADGEETKRILHPPGPKRGSLPTQTIYVTQADGIYQLILGTRINGPSTPGSNLSYKANVHIEIFSDYGYLSAADYPLLIFYSTMCVIYVIYGIGWLVVSFMRWRELLRVQYWIGAVILLGMLEKAVFTAEYESVNKRGSSVPGLIVFAELVSVAKRTLSRMLVIIVSFGFGIVKPRLGVVLHRVVGIGLLYFILASIEGCMRALKPKISDDGYSKRLLFAIIPLALLESAICWWVFSALVSTTRTLRLRRNTVKLNLFRHFTNTLIFAVITSIIFMLWSIKYQNYDSCLNDWKQLWVNDAFWHVLFAIILLVIMILWRPTNNNQRFAFSPLLDEGSDGEEETEKLMANVSDTMKLRGTTTSSRGSSSPSPRGDGRSVDDDLRWVEENIPSSITDTGLPVMDSDEEILTTKFEISKMQ